MSIDICVICDNAVDTDYYPEAYRDSLYWHCICDTCWEKLTEDNVQQLRGKENGST